MPIPARPAPSTEEKLETLLNRLEGALDRTERKIEDHQRGYQDHPEQKEPS